MDAMTHDQPEKSLIYSSTVRIKVYSPSYRINMSHAIVTLYFKIIAQALVFISYFSPPCLLNIRENRNFHQLLMNIFGHQLFICSYVDHILSIATNCP